MYRFGFGLFLLAEAMIFLTLFASRFVLAGLGRPRELSEVAAAALTLLMWLSVVPALGALRAARRGDAAALVRSLLLTMSLGILLLAGAAVEWSQLGAISMGSRFGGVFFTSLGAHAVHTFAGVLVLAGIAASAARGRFTPASHFAVEAGIAFWLFLVGVWIALYAVFYLL
jgi:heme/copper-type cytochrome/quinol oxidase subunit 3